MNKHFAIGCMWLSVAAVSFNDVKAAAAIGFFAMIATIVMALTRS